MSLMMIFLKRKMRKNIDNKDDLDEDWRTPILRLPTSPIVLMAKRLMTEYKELSINPPDGITAGPVSESNWFEWEAMIQGPEVGTVTLLTVHACCQRLNLLAAFLGQLSVWSFVELFPLQINNSFSPIQKDTPYEDGIFLASLSFPKDYPLSPPVMKFTSEMYHPNIVSLTVGCISHQSSMVVR